MARKHVRIWKNQLSRAAYWFWYKPAMQAKTAANDDSRCVHVLKTMPDVSAD